MAVDMGSGIIDAINNKVDNSYNELFPALKDMNDNGNLYIEQVFDQKIPRWEHGEYLGDETVTMHKLIPDEDVDEYILSVLDDVANYPNLNPVERYEVWLHFKLKFSKLFPIFALDENITDKFMKYTYQIEAGGEWEMINGIKTLTEYNPEHSLLELNQVMINIIAAFQLGFPYRPPQGSIQNVSNDWIIDFSNVIKKFIIIINTSEEFIIEYYSDDQSDTNKLANSLNLYKNVIMANTKPIKSISLITECIFYLTA